MRSYLWQWSVFLFICLYNGNCDGKPIFNNLISKMGRGIQKAISAFKNTLPASSLNAKKNIHTGDEDSQSSNYESESEIKTLSDEEFMEELKKVADSDTEGTKEAKEILHDIEIGRSSGKSLSQAIDSAEKKVNSSRKQLKCGGGMGLLSFFYIWFQGLFNLSSLFGRRRQSFEDSVVADIDTETRNIGWLRSSPLAAWWSRLKPRRRSGLVTEYIDKTQETEHIIKPTTKIVEEYITDEHGVVTHRIINRLPIGAISERFSSIHSTAPVINNPTQTAAETVKESILREGQQAIQLRQTVDARSSTAPTGSIDMMTETVPKDRPSSPSSVEVKERFRSTDQSSGSTIKDMVLSPPRLIVSTRETASTYPTMSQTTSSPPDRTISSMREARLSPSLIDTESIRLLQPPNPSTSSYAKSVEGRSFRPPESPSPNLPSLISGIMSEVNQTATDRRQTADSLINSAPELNFRVPRFTQPQRTDVDLNSRPNSDQLQLVPGAWYRKDNETPKALYYNRADNTYVAIPRET